MMNGEVAELITALKKKIAATWHAHMDQCGRVEERLLGLFNSLINSVDILDERPNSNYKYIRN